MSQIPKPHSPYFLVRVSKKTEKEMRMPKFGSIIIPETLAFMQYNTQCGEIVDIGQGAAEYFPEAKVGHILLMHHFVQANDENEARVNHLIHDDEDFNYYVVTAYPFNGKDCEAYGVWDGEKIIPNKEYVFLQKEKKSAKDLPFEKLPDLPDEEVDEVLTKSKGGLLLFNEWEESREAKEVKQAGLKSEVQELSKSGNHKLHIKQGILQKEWEMEAISRDINFKTYLPYTVAFANKQLSGWFDRSVGTGDILGMLNMSVHTVFNFNNEQYIVAKTKFVAYLFDKENMGRPDKKLSEKVLLPTG